MNYLIKTENLSKTYPGTAKPALNNLNLAISSGEIYGFLGANGAGKSTTIRLLLNFIQPSSGQAKIFGNTVKNDEIRREIGYLSGDVVLWNKSTGHEIFEFLGRLGKRVDQEYLDYLIKKLDAEPHKKIYQLSKGNRQKIGLIQALMHRPKVLILDEPTSGLDPLIQEVFYEIIKDFANQGSAILISSHNLYEAQSLCSKIGIIKEGNLVHEQKISDDSKLNIVNYRVTFANNHDLTKFTKLKSHEFKIVSENVNQLLIQPTNEINEVLKVLSNFKITSLTSEQINLGDEFLEYYGETNANA